MLPTNIAKPKVLSIQEVVRRVVKSPNIASIDAKIAKSLTIQRPRTTPLKREIKTFLV